MSYLIDTCCISELVKKKPDPNVVKWFAAQAELSMYLSIITFAELRKGSDKVSHCKRTKELKAWVKEDLSHRFKNRVLSLHTEEVNRWGEILAIAEKVGKPLPAVDAVIAATALVHELTVVTRNTKDMAGSGTGVVNPWG